MTKQTFGKKSQIGLGPDVLVGFLLIVILGLGGVFFLNAFINGLALTGLLTVLDTETDQKCFFMLLPLAGDDYIRSGVPYAQLKNPQFKSLKEYFSNTVPYEDNQYEYKSYEFERTISTLKGNLPTVTLSTFPVRIVGIEGFLTSSSNTNKVSAPGNYIPCSMTVYGPYEIGTANLFILTTGDITK